MREEVLNELVESVREGMAILRGEGMPSRVFVAEDSDVAAIRLQCRLSRQEFANRIGVSVRTVREWERGQRAPRGPAPVLLEVAAKYPEAVRDILQSPLRINEVAPEQKSKVA